MATKLCDMVDDFVLRRKRKNEDDKFVRETRTDFIERINRRLSGNKVLHGTKYDLTLGVQNSTTFDVAKFKVEHPDLYERYIVRGTYNVLNDSER